MKIREVKKQGSMETREYPWIGRWYLTDGSYRIRLIFSEDYSLILDDEPDDAELIGKVRKGKTASYVPYDGVFEISN